MQRMCAVLVGVSLLIACNPPPAEALEPVLFVFRPDPPAFVEVAPDLVLRREIPFAMPDGCGMGIVTPAPRGPLLGIELNCAFGPAVLLLNVDTGKFQQPVKTSDSHLLAWAPSGQELYLRVDSINRPRILRQGVDGKQDDLGLSEWTYDVAPAPRGDSLIFSFSKGMGLGSEMWSADLGGTAARPLLRDGESYIALARWSPDGSRIAFIKIPDTPTPFTVGELWVMNADGSGAWSPGPADAGHGFEPAWSPDGSRIAFVVRENPDDRRADSVDGALLSNLYTVVLATGDVARLSNLDRARVSAAAWRPGDHLIAFGVVVNDRMAVFLQNADSDQAQDLGIEGACCAAWLRR